MGIVTAAALVLLDVVDRSTGALVDVSRATYIGTWLSVPIALVVTAAIYRLRHPFVAGGIFAVCLVTWVAVKSLVVLPAPGIVQAAYGFLVSGMAGGIIAIDATGWLDDRASHIRRLRGAARVRAYELHRNELHFYLQTTLFAVFAIATVVGVTMTIVFNGEFVGNATGEPVATADERLQTAFAMLTLAAVVIALLGAFVFVPLVFHWWRVHGELIDAYATQTLARPRSIPHYDLGSGALGGGSIASRIDLLDAPPPP